MPGLFEGTLAGNTSIGIARSGSEYRSSHGIRFLETDGSRRQALYDRRV